MADIIFCRRCLYGESHPLGLVIDGEGICSGCRIHEEKDSLDWSYRWDELKKLVAPYRSTNGENYDCIVPVSGAHDSYYILHLVKNKLKLNPLLVTYNKYFNTPLGIRNLANLRIKFDCDSADGQFKKTADNQKLMKLYPETEFTSIDDGIATTVEWFNITPDYLIRK